MKASHADRNARFPIQSSRGSEPVRQSRHAAPTDETLGRWQVAHLHVVQRRSEGGMLCAGGVQEPAAPAVPRVRNTHA